MSRFIQGIYKIQNPKKYKGDASNCVYRSSWELKYMMELDRDDSVIEWSSEETIIPYRDHVGKLRRYFMDFKVKRKIGEKEVVELIEIKPKVQTQPPKPKGTRKAKTVIKEVLTWETNQRKWTAAQLFCEKNGWEFRILTEDELGIPKR